MKHNSALIFSIIALMFIPLIGASPIIEMKNCSDHNPSVNWNRTAVTNPRQVEQHEAAKCNCTPVNTASRAPKAEYCPEDWFHYDISCYWYSKQSSNVGDALEDCLNRNATLFVANDKDELMNVTRRTTGYRWIGITKENSKLAAEWQSPSEMPIKDINWLIKPANEDYAGNGWTDLARCVTNFNPFVNATAGFFNFFYPCDWKFDYICERNATVFTSGCAKGYTNTTVLY